MTARLRFYRRLRVLPGVTLNLGKRGINSVSVGQRGAHLTFGRHGRQRATIGLPGTGLYLTEELHPHHQRPRQPTNDTGPQGPTGPKPAQPLIPSLAMWILAGLLAVAMLLAR